MAITVPAQGIEYPHLRALGGRRGRRGCRDVTDAAEGSGDAWRVLAFRRYAEYAQTPQYLEGLEHFSRPWRNLKRELKNIVSDLGYQRCSLA